MQRSRALTRLADLLQRGSQRPELRSKLAERRCLAAWPQAVGERIAAATRPISFRNGTLTVGCKSSVWRSELALMRSKIAVKLNSILGEQSIQRVKFSTAWERKAIGEDEPRRRGQGAGSGELEELRPAERAEIRTALSRIDDEKVSQALFSAWATKRSLDKARRTQGWDDCPDCGALKSPDASTCPVCESHKR